MNIVQQLSRLHRPSSGAVSISRLALAMVFALALMAQAAYASPKKTKQERVSQVLDSLHVRMAKQADAWFEQGDFPKCIQNLRVLRSLFPSDYEIATNLGWMLENVHEWNEALSVYVSYKQGNPQDPDAAWPEANFYFMKKSYAKIPSLLEPALKHASTPHPNTFRTLAHAYDKLGLLKDSKRVWEQMVKTYPNDEAAKVNLKRVSDKIDSGKSA